MPLQFPIKWEYDTIAYRMAASKKELCTKTKKVPLSEQFEQHPEFQVKHVRFILLMRPIQGIGSNFKSKAFVCCGKRDNECISCYIDKAE